MKTTFTPQEIMDSKGCYSEEDVNKLSFISKSEIHINDVLDSEIPIKDKFWFVRNNCGLTTSQKQWLAIGLAEITLEIYEKKYPNNKAPREAIQAAKDYLNGLIDKDNLWVKKRAAYAAADATYADAADAYAAYAAYAAATYADAADAYAAYAAYAAATYADAVAARISAKHHFKVDLLIFVKNFVKIESEKSVTI